MPSLEDQSKIDEACTEIGFFTVTGHDVPQAAMDALRQWKYQPATLDGKSTAMHLTVTIQFRLQ